MKAPTEFRDYIYAALELRLCIERLCFEYLAIGAYKKRSLTKSELKLYKPKDLLKKFADEQPHYAQVDDFTNALLESQGVEERVFTPDSQWLIETHGKLNDYLHLQPEGLSETRKRKLIELCKEGLEQLGKHILLRARPDHLKAYSQSILDKYIDGKINKDQMRRMMGIDTIPIHLYNKRPRE